MKVAVGSTNETKVQAVKEILKDYPRFAGADIVAVEVDIDVNGHPKTLDEIVSGAKLRAERALKGCDYSFGIESGIFSVPYTKTGFIEMAVCAIYDGRDYHLGTAPGFEWPKKVIDGILTRGLDGSAAVRAAGLTDHEKIGTAGGVISILTNGRMTRTQQNQLAVMMALIHLEHPEFYA